MTKKRVYEVAKELGITTADVIERMKALSVEVKSHSSSVDDDVFKKLQKMVSPPKKKSAAKASTKKAEKVASSIKGKKEDSARSASKKAKTTATGKKKATAKDSKPEKEAKPKPPPAKKSQKPPTEVKTESKSVKKPRPASKLHKAKQDRSVPPPEDSFFKIEEEESDELTGVSTQQSYPSAADVIREQEQHRPRMLKVKKVKRRKIITPKPPVKTASQRKKISESPTADKDKIITLSEGVTVKELADKLGVRVKDVIRKIMDRGLFLNLNQVMERDLAMELAEEWGYVAEVVSFEEEVNILEGEGEDHESNVIVRAPVITVMGHVDHGKTSLMDVIRKANVVESEHGGITQHIGAYTVQVGGNKMVFLDTPGHEAFTKMRARGAQVTDIVVLVVAADDGVKQQTREAIDHAKAAQVPIVVAINKVDKPEANVDRVKQQLSELELAPEDWGGNTVMCEVSAKKQTGIDYLLEMLNLTAEMRELRADANRKAQGYIIEAKRDPGRGPVATVLVLDGTLREGDPFIAGAVSGKIRAMVDDRGERVTEAKAATPVEVWGLQDLPKAGDVFQVLKDEIKARQIQSYRQQKMREQSLANNVGGGVTLESLFDKISEGEVKEVNVIIKADVQGSAEVLQSSISKLGTDEIQVKVIHTGVGAVTESNILLATASKAIVVAFNVRPRPEAVKLAKKENVDIRAHTVIYEITNEIKEAMEHKLEPTLEEISKGRVEVRDTFRLPKGKIIAGSFVVDGTISRKDHVRLLRDDVVIFTGRIASLRRFKEDVSEVKKNFECGVGLENFNDIHIGDVIESFEIKQVASKLQ